MKFILSYLIAARNHIMFLQKYENAPKDIVEIKDGLEPLDFLKIWFHTEEKLEKFNRNHFSDNNTDTNAYYKDVRTIKINIIRLIYPLKTRRERWILKFRMKL